MRAWPVTRRNRHARTLHRRAPELVECPLGDGWKKWDMFGPRETDYRLITDEERGRCEAARRPRNLQHRRAVTPRWEFAAGCGPDTTNQLLHAETHIEGRRVHVDYVERHLGGPGRTVSEIRIFVDGLLEGRGGMVGCSLGSGGGDLPAVARITPSLVLAADLVPAVVVPVVELWQVPEHGTPLTVRLGTLSIEEFESVSPQRREEIEASAADLEKRYSQSWFERHRRRLRSELEFAYGVALDPE